MWGFLMNLAESGKTVHRLVAECHESGVSDTLEKIDDIIQVKRIEFGRDGVPDIQHAGPAIYEIQDFVLDQEEVNDALLRWRF
jgi:hypothetical protein